MAKQKKQENQSIAEMEAAEAQLAKEDFCIA